MILQLSLLNTLAVLVKLANVFQPYSQTTPETAAIGMEITKMPVDGSQILTLTLDQTAVNVELVAMTTQIKQTLKETNASGIEEIKTSVDGTILTSLRPTGTAALADSKVVSIMEDVTLVVTDATGMMITFLLVDSGILLISKQSVIAALVLDRDQEEATTHPELVMITMLWLSKWVKMRRRFMKLQRTLQSLFGLSQNLILLLKPMTMQRTNQWKNQRKNRKKSQSTALLTMMPQKKSLLKKSFQTILLPRRQLDYLQEVLNMKKLF